jgi:hypothetical protein
MPGEVDRRLELTFVIESESDLSPTDFLGVFECADNFVRHLVEHEALELFEDLNLPSEWRLTTLQQVRRLGRRAPAPGQIARVERGSWEITTVIPGFAVLWFVKHYLHPVVQEAWNDSRLRQAVVEFLRRKIFLGAKRSLEQKAVEVPRYKGLEVASIDEVPQPSGAYDVKLRIRLDRREVIDVSSSDQELIEEFLRRIGR